MADSANVLSVDALASLREGLLRYEHNAQQVLSAGALQVQRALEWIGERVIFWQRQVERCEQRARAARRSLTACEAAAEAASFAVCASQRREVSLAERRLAEAREALKTAQQWRLRLDAAAREYRAGTSRLSGWLTAVRPQATSLLEREIGHLVDYVGVASPSTSTAAASGGGPAAIASVAELALSGWVEALREQVLADEERERSATLVSTEFLSGATDRAAPQHAAPVAGAPPYRVAISERGAAERIETGPERSEKERF